RDSIGAAQAGALRQAQCEAQEEVGRRTQAPQVVAQQQRKRDGRPGRASLFVSGDLGRLRAASGGASLHRHHWLAWTLILFFIVAGTAAGAGAQGVSRVYVIPDEGTIDEGYAARVVRAVSLAQYPTDSAHAIE